MSINSRRWLAAWLCAMAAAGAQAQLQPWGEYPVPPAPAVAGQPDDPQVRLWMKRQNEFAGQLLAHINGRDALRQRLAVLQLSAPNPGALREVQGRQFYLERAADRSQRLFMRNAATGGERILLSSAAGEHIDFFTPSPDANLLAVGISGGAAGARALRVLQVSDGSWLDEAITSIAADADAVSWKPDGSALFYRRSPAAAAGAGAGAYWQHNLGQAGSKDQPVLGYGLSRPEKFKRSEALTLQTQAGSAYLIAESRQGQQRSVYLARLDQLKAAATPWQKLAGPADGVRGVWLAGDQLYLLSAKKSANGSLLKLDLKQPRLTAAREIVKAGKDELLELAVAGDALYLHAQQDGVSKLLRLDQAGEEKRELDLPLAGRLSQLQADPAGTGAMLMLEDAVSAPVRYRVRANGQLQNLAMTRPAPDGFRQIVSQRRLLPGAGGRQFALTLLYRDNIRRDGQRPTLLIADASGSNAADHFDATRLAWLEQDGVIALAHLAPGAAAKPGAPDAADDLLAAADYLVREAYTAPKKLVAQETAADAMLVAAAITRRPDAFAAVQGGVLAQHASAAVGKRTPAMPETGPYQAIREGVREGVRYPAAWFRGAAGDGMAAASFVARLQAASASNSKPVIWRAEDAAASQLDALADSWAFFLWQIGQPGYSWQQPGFSKPRD